MGLFRRLFTRASIENPKTPLTGEILSNAGGLDSEVIDPDTAMKVAAYNACIRVISGDLGILPINVMQRVEIGSRKATDHPIYRLFHDAPNDWQTPQGFIETIIAHALRFGNGVGFIEKDRARASGIYILPPRQTTAFIEAGQLFYQSFIAGKWKRFTPDQIFHIMGYSRNGYWGVAPIEEAARSVGIALQADKFAERFFKNGMNIKGYLKHPAKLSAEAKGRLRETMDDFRGSDNAHGTPLLEEGLDYHEAGVAPEQMQLLESRLFQKRDICSLFRIAPYKIGDMEKATAGNVEQQGIEHVQNCLMRWIRAIELEANRKLFWESEKETYYVKVNADAFVRGNQTARFLNYKTGILTGFMSVNQVEELEDWNLTPGGDKKLVPLNMAQQANAGDMGQNPLMPEPQQQESKSRFDLLLQDAARRLLTKERNAIERAKKKGEITEWLGTFYDDHKQLVRSTFLPVVMVAFECDQERANETLNKLVEDHVAASLDDALSDEPQYETRAANYTLRKYE